MQLIFVDDLREILMDPHLHFLSEEPFKHWREEYMNNSDKPQNDQLVTKPGIIDRLKSNSETVEDVYIPKSILKIRSTHKRTRDGKFSKKGLLFKVEWRGYSEEDATWEPYRYLKDNIVFHQYCLSNQLEYLIPAYHYR